MLAINSDWGPLQTFAPIFPQEYDVPHLTSSPHPLSFHTNTVHAHKQSRENKINCTITAYDYIEWILSVGCRVPQSKIIIIICNLYYYYSYLHNFTQLINFTYSAAFISQLMPRMRWCSWFYSAKLPRELSEKLKVRGESFPHWHNYLGFLCQCCPCATKLISRQRKTNLSPKCHRHSSDKLAFKNSSS